MLCSHRRADPADCCANPQISRSTLKQEKGPNGPLFMGVFHVSCVRRSLHGPGFHEVRELPSECLHALVEPSKIVLNMRMQQRFHAVVGELHF